MSYDGLEIDMLSLGNADSILVTRWYNGSAERVLIDGGTQSSVSTVRRFLRGQGVVHLDHVVCSHPHDDHAGGLVDLVKDSTLSIGRLWAHLPIDHIDIDSVVAQVRKHSTLKEAQVITESLQTHISLVQAAMERKIPISQPFSGEKIGSLTVCGPSPEYYQEIMSQFTNESYYSLENSIAARVLERLEEQVDESSDSLLDNPQTDPLNNTATILATKVINDIYVFTADAGAQSLAAALKDYAIADCKWMQVPHHGSRRNITQGLIEEFSPKTAFVSAEGSKKHPRTAVVNAIKKQGARVYSTHYPNGGHLRHHNGTVPERTEYTSATPLWEAKQ